MASSADAAEANVLKSKAGVVPRAAKKKAGPPAVVQELGSSLCLLSSRGRPRRDSALYFERAA